MTTLRHSSATAGQGRSDDRSWFGMVELESILGKTSIREIEGKLERNAVPIFVWPILDIAFANS